MLAAETAMQPKGEIATPTYAEALPVWLKIGLLSFGGPAGQIGLMHKILVEEKKWIDEPRYLSALNFCMLLPGPEAMQLATYVGWKAAWRQGRADRGAVVRDSGRTRRAGVDRALRRLR